MEFTTDLHTHTVFCDGENSAEEMVLAALEKGLRCLGFSGHSFTPHDVSYCMTEEATKAYRKEIARLKKKYAGKIRILRGIELDYYSPEDALRYDYAIASVHYVFKDGVYMPVDEMPNQAEGVKKLFGGDFYAFAETYFETVGRYAERDDWDIVGHFDLLSKFNEREDIFDPRHPRYRAAWKKAADRLLPLGKPFEINTGAVSRGLRSEPYPSREIVNYLLENGARFVPDSDSHRRETLCFGFDSLAYLGDALITNWRPKRNRKNA